jgi:hypothetical protein
VAGAVVAAVVATVVLAAAVVLFAVGTLVETLAELVVVALDPPPHAVSNIIDNNTTQPNNRAFTSFLPFTDAPTGIPELFPRRRTDPLIASLIDIRSGVDQVYEILPRVLNGSLEFCRA